MTEGEYKELKELLGGQSAGIDRRFDGIDAKLDAHDQRLTRLEIIQEQHADLIRLVAEGVVSVREALDRGFKGVDRRFDEMTAFFRSLFLDQRERIDALDVRVTRLERRKR